MGTAGWGRGRGLTRLLLVLGVAGIAALSWAPAASVQPVDGQAVYQLRCAVCHGTEGEGRPGTGVAAGPALRELPVAYMDLVLRTGRMPLAHEELGVTEQRLSSEQREALVRWADDALDLTGRIPEVGPGDPRLGQQVYTRSCAACHGASGGGGVAGGGTVVPPVRGVDRVAVVEALRVGPFEMPVFGDQVISQEEADAVAAYAVEELSRGEATPLGLTEVGPVATAALAAVVVGTVVAATVLVSRIGRAAGAGEESR